MSSDIKIRKLKRAICVDDILNHVLERNNAEVSLFQTNPQFGSYNLHEKLKARERLSEPACLVWKRMEACEPKPRPSIKRKSRRRSSLFSSAHLPKILFVPTHYRPSVSSHEFFRSSIASTVRGKQIIHTLISNLKSAIAQSMYDKYTTRKYFVTKVCPKLPNVRITYPMPYYHQRAYEIHDTKESVDRIKKNCLAFTYASSGTRIKDVMGLLSCVDFLNTDIPVSLRKQLLAIYRQHTDDAAFHLKKLESYPEELQNIMSQIKNDYNTPVFLDPSTANDFTEEIQFQFKDTLTVPSGSILIEWEQERPVANGFYINLLKEHIQKLKLPLKFILANDKGKIEKKINETIDILIENGQTPGDPIRMRMMRLIGSSEFNPIILNHLSQEIQLWLNELFLCLTSTYGTIRQEACIVLCYMTKIFPLMKELCLHRVYDVFYDFMISAIEATEKNQSSFTEYYMVICHIMHYCPVPGIIEPMLERLRVLKLSEFRTHWIRIIYFAFKYWPDSVIAVLKRDRDYLNDTLKSKLEKALLSKKTRKSAISALYHFSRRTQIYSDQITVYPHLLQSKICKEA